MDEREAYDRGYEAGYPEGFRYRMNIGNDRTLKVTAEGLDWMKAGDTATYRAGHDEGWATGYRRADILFRKGRGG